MACSTQLHSGGIKACTGRGECNRAAPDAQPSANAKKDSLTIRAGMARKMIAYLHRVLWRNIITTLDNHDPQHHNVCLSFVVNISVSCLLYCNTISRTSTGIRPYTSFSSNC